MCDDERINQLEFHHSQNHEGNNQIPTYPKKSIRKSGMCDENKKNKTKNAETNNSSTKSLT